MQHLRVPLLSLQLKTSAEVHFKKPRLLVLLRLCCSTTCGWLKHTNTDTHTHTSQRQKSPEMMKDTDMMNSEVQTWKDHHKEKLHDRDEEEEEDRHLQRNQLTHI